MVQDAKDKGSDALPGGGQPLAPEGQTPSEKPDVVLFTKEEKDKEVSDRLSTQGRELADLRRKAEDRDRLAEAVETHRKQLEALQDLADAKELEALEGSPDLKAIHLRLRATDKQLKEREAAVKQTEIEHGSAMERVKQLALLETAQSVAKEFSGVSAVDLLDMGLAGEEQMRKAAEKLAEKAKGAPPVIRADSAIGSGGGLSWEETKRRYARGEISTSDYEEAKKTKGG